MTKIMLAAAAAAAVLMAAPVSGTIAKAASLTGVQMAQVEVQVGRDRDRDYDRNRHRDRDVTVGVGPGGIAVGPRRHCQTRTTWVERDNGRRIKKTERVCD